MVNKKTKLLNNFLILLALIFIINLGNAIAQVSTSWTQQQTIPGYEDDTWPPVLIADQNRTVHAISSQWLSGFDGPAERAIMYNQWTMDNGWTAPVDVLMSPLRSDARLLDAMLDDSGMLHVIFWGGDNTEAAIYYANAHIADAGKAPAWSRPVLVADDAQDPENGVIYNIDQDTLVILFSGKLEGSGLYYVQSEDGGYTWSEQVLLFNTTDNANLINELQSYRDDLGRTHAIWNEITVGGQGRGIYYSSSEAGEIGWSKPINLAEAEIGYGTNTPAVIEHRDQIIALYNLDGVIWQRLSEDSSNWSSPTRLFARHGGVNGSLSLVVDSNDDLHLFFGQRITGSPDIHGMWHSIFQDANWSDPEPVASGPNNPDQTGNKAFDPFEARAAISQGNVLLVTWRSDPGLKGNGVWYAYKVIDSPELPVISPDSLTPADNPTPISALIPDNNQLVTESFSGIIETTPESYSDSILINNPVSSLVVGMIPVILLSTLLIVVSIVSRNRR